MNMDTQTLPALFALLTKLDSEENTQTAAATQAALDHLNTTATKTGFELFSLENYAQAELPLTVAAAQGNAEAQYALATCVSSRDGGFRRASEATRKWLWLAAAQNHVPALMRLGDAASLKKANELLTPAALAGDAEAMVLLFKLTDEVKWLSMAVAKNHHHAQFLLAVAYRKTPDLVPNSVERSALIEELLQKAADGNDMLALADRVFPSDSTADVKEKQHRLIQLAQLGQIDALLEYGYALAHLPRSGKGTSNFPRRHATAARTYGLEKDLARAYATLNFVMPKLASDAQAEVLAQDLDAIRHQMNPTQFAGAERIDHDLKRIIPSLFKSMERLIIVGAPY
ncbi:sel1 repeat family protein [Pseudomonas sp. B6002]|uniref:tetratricopeptide repeat protein n=1 Tax=Pseudomonas sp. B6002 TaxID=2726978 RepID=UPI0015A33A12|nr:sel1 repeat family protein [Pseudomonas sp. B6002]NVZ50531.1 sel1 repeat family protein [Pseudomonas sp. B6002]